MPKAAPVVAEPEVVEEVQAPDPDAAIMSGGPGEETPPEVKTVKMKVGDREVDVPEGLASVFNESMDELRAQIEELRTVQPKAAPAPAVPAVQEAGYDFATMIFVNPAEAIAKLEEQILNKVSNAYVAEQSKVKFWADFYKENEDLSDADFVVQSILTNNYSSLSAMETGKARKELAKLARAATAKLLKRREPATNDRQELEGASTPEVKEKTVQAANAVVSSLSSVIKARQAAKRQAAHK